MLPVFWLTWSAVTLLAFIPSYAELPDLVSFSDLLNHAVAFFVLTLLLSFTYTFMNLRQIAMLTLLYAVFIEAVQYFLPTRHASFADIIADSVGMLIALAVIKHLRSRDFML